MQKLKASAKPVMHYESIFIKFPVSYPAFGIPLQSYFVIKLKHWYHFLVTGIHSISTADYQLSIKHQVTNAASLKSHSSTRTGAMHPNFHICSLLLIYSRMCKYWLIFCAFLYTHDEQYPRQHTVYSKRKKLHAD